MCDRDHPTHIHLYTYGTLTHTHVHIRSLSPFLSLSHLPHTHTSHTHTHALCQVREHCGEDSLWVVYGGDVYDVTGFLREHPGGMEALLGAAGQVRDSSIRVRREIRPHTHTVFYSAERLGHLSPSLCGHNIPSFET